MNTILEILLNSKTFGNYIKDVKNNKMPIMLSGLTGVAKVQMSSATSFFTDKSLIYITSNEIEAKKVLDDFKYFDENAIYFPKRDIKNFDTFAESKDNLFERIEVLNKIKENKIKIIVTTIDAVTQPMILPESLYRNNLKFKIGDNTDVNSITEKLMLLGYERQDLIDGLASFSIRGGIIDISLDKNTGVRIELWGDEVESIRLFNILTQRSDKELKEIKIYPATEFVLDKNLKEVEQAISKIPVAGKVLSYITDDLMDIKQINYKNKIEKYFKRFYPEYGTFLDYINNNYLIVVDEIGKLKQRLDNINKDNNLIIRSIYEKERYGIESLEIQQDFKKFSYKIENMNIVFLSEDDLPILNKQSMHAKRNGYSFNYREVNFFRNSLDFLFEEIKKAEKNNNTIILLAGDSINGLQEILENREISFVQNINNYSHKSINNIIEEDKIEEGKINILKGELSSGYFDEDLNILLISFHELFQRRVEKRQLTKSYKSAEKIRYSDLELGDYVVHRINGIGRFIEIMKLTTMGITKDYIKIEYRGGDLLYVPTNALDNIRKYISKDGITPKLNKLRY